MRRERGQMQASDRQVIVWRHAITTMATAACTGQESLARAVAIGVMHSGEYNSNELQQQDVLYLY